MTVVITPPIKVLKIDRRYPTIVAVFELVINICTKLVNEIMAIPHPIKVIHSNKNEVSLKN